MSGGRTLRAGGLVISLVVVLTPPFESGGNENFVPDALAVVGVAGLTVEDKGTVADDGVSVGRARPYDFVMSRSSSRSSSIEPMRPQTPKNHKAQYLWSAFLGNLCTAFCNVPRDGHGNSNICPIYLIFNIPTLLAGI